MPRSLIILGVFVGFAILIGSLFAVWQTVPKNYAPPDDTSITVSSAAPAVPTITLRDPVRGNFQATTTIVEYSDFECPHCADVDPVLQQLVQKYPQKVRLIWKDMPDTTVHFKALGAHVAARCAQAQGKFWEYHDVLFNHQLELAPENYALWAQQLGLNSDAFNLCLAQQRGKDIVQSNRIEGLQLGVNATPYFFIGTERKSGVVALEEFERLIQ